MSPVPPGAPPVAPHVAPHVARRRWLALVGIRLAGVAGAMLGLVLAARAHGLAPRVIGIALVLSALLVIAIVPASLAHRWRSPVP